MTSAPPKDIALLLALCPAIAVSDTLVNAIGLGAAILSIILLSTLIMRSIDRWLIDQTRIVTLLLIAAACTASIEMLMDAWMHDLRESLAVFLTVAAVNIALLDRAMTPIGIAGALVSATKTGGAIAGILIVLGAVREMVGRGSLLHDAASLLGPGAAGAEINLFSVDMGFLLAMLPPGAFIALGLLLAARNWMAQRRSRPDSA